MNALYLGIEFGSTRIKAALIDSEYRVVASGAHDWENRLENGVWTYHLDDVWSGLQDAYARLAAAYQARVGLPLEHIGAIGVSAMMHGYLAFDKNDKQLAEFRTWRNTMTAEAAEKLSARFNFNIPQRWTIAHLYQALLNKEAHVKDIAHLTTLAGFVHWRLTGQKVVGAGEAAGIMPTEKNGLYNKAMMEDFNALAKEALPGLEWTLEDILPAVSRAGEKAGTLSDTGAKLLDPSGNLKAGIPFCPPEGDAGTGMTATNSVRPRSGNVSAGTSIFAMVVMEKPLKQPYPEIDVVATPAGAPVAMVHCNNCTGDIDAWVNLFMELGGLNGSNMTKPALYDMLYEKALEGAPDCGGLLTYNFYSGEHTIGLEAGRPLLLRKPDSRFNLANLMRSLICSSMAALKMGMEILLKEGVRIDTLTGHGGLFKTPVVGQRLMAAALETPVTTLESAGEGGPWGMALLAAYMAYKTSGGPLSLENYLSEKVFASSEGETIAPGLDDINGFKAYMQHYTPGLEIERTAIKAF